jgi:hypothetical protein
VFRFTVAGPAFPIAACVFSCYIAYHEGRYKTCLQQIVLVLAFLPSPWAHTFNIGITYSPRQLIFQDTKTEIHSLRQLAVLLLHCEIHKLYSKWQVNVDHTTFTGEGTPHENHSRENRTSRTETHYCHKDELESVVPANLQRYILEENNYLVLGFGMRKEEPQAFEIGERFCAQIARNFPLREICRTYYQQLPLLFLNISYSITSHLVMYQNLFSVIQHRGTAYRAISSSLWVRPPLNTPCNSVVLHVVS